MRIAGHGWPAAASQTWMSDRAGDHAPAGTPLFPKPVPRLFAYGDAELGPSPKSQPADMLARDGGPHLDPTLTPRDHPGPHRSAASQPWSCTRALAPRCAADP